MVSNGARTGGGFPRKRLRTMGSVGLEIGCERREVLKGDAVVPTLVDMLLMLGNVVSCLLNTVEFWRRVDGEIILVHWLA